MGMRPHSPRTTIAPGNGLGGHTCSIIPWLRSTDSNRVPLGHAMLAISGVTPRSKA